MANLSRVVSSAGSARAKFLCQEVLKKHVAWLEETFPPLDGVFLGLPILVNFMYRLDAGA